MKPYEPAYGRFSIPLPGDICFENLSVGSLIKSAGLSVRSGQGLCGSILDYFELVREYDREKLFITLNLRSVVPDGEAELFLDSVLLHGYNLLMIESADLPRLKKEARYTVDRDLCEIC